MKLWASWDDFRKSMNPSTVNEDDFDRVAREPALARAIQLGLHAEALEAGARNLPRWLRISRPVLEEADAFHRRMFEAARNESADLIRSIEWLSLLLPSLTHQSRLRAAHDGWLGFVWPLHDDLTDEIEAEIKAKASATAQVATALVDEVIESFRRLPSPPNGMPPEIKRLFVEANDALSIGLEELGAFGMFRTLEATLREISRRGAIMIQRAARQGGTPPTPTPLWEARLVDFIEGTNRLELPSGDRLCTKPDRQLMQLMREMRNVAGHANPNDFNTWTDAAILAGKRIRAIWKSADDAAFNLSPSTVQKDW